MTESDVVELAVSLRSDEWRALTTQVAWAHRQGNPLPSVFAEVEDIVMDRDSWRDIRTRVKKLRMENARKAKAERQRKAEERRRDYMRAYMSRRRRKE